MTQIGLFHNPAIFHCPCPICGDDHVCARCEMRREAAAAWTPELEERERARLARFRAERERQAAAELAQVEAWRALGRPLRVALVGCAKSKLDHAAPARDLYTGALFRKSLELAERTCDLVLILSAYHGIVEPAQLLEPYDRALSDARLAERQAWGQRTGRALADMFAGVDVHVIALASSTYLDVIGAPGHWTWNEPLRGLQIGQRLSALNQALAELRPCHEPTHMEERR